MKQDKLTLLDHLRDYEPESKCCGKEEDWDGVCGSEGCLCEKEHAYDLNAHYDGVKG